MVDIDKEKCVGCMRCVPYCPMRAFVVEDESISIDQERCVECAICIRSGACRTDALYMPALPWPRAIRAMFSGGGLGYGPRGTDTISYGYITGKISLPERSPEEVKSQNFGGGGTVEMKTNDATTRFREGEVGIACEMGRPSVGFYFRDLEKVSKALANHGMEFEPSNPVSTLIDHETGEIREEYWEIRDEKVLRGIIETRTDDMEKAVRVLKDLKNVASTIDSVFSVDIINKCENGKIPFKPMLDEAGIEIMINGKTCVGLGRRIE